MESCRLCGAQVMDKDELRKHNEQLHPNLAGKKGGEPKEPHPKEQPPLT